MVDDKKIMEAIIENTSKIDTYSDEEKRTLADITYWILSKESVTPTEMSYRFNIDINAANTMIEFMVNKGLLIPRGGKLIPNENISEENDIIVNLRNFYSDEEILRVGEKDTPREEKEERSRILSSTDYAWVSVDEHVPDEDEVVAIRIQNKGKIIDETSVDIEYMESVYVATYSGTEWIIKPPYLAYDLSGITEGEKVLVSDDITVTHWTKISDEEVQKWNDRLNVLGEYGMMSFSVDKNCEKKVYESLTIASRILFNNLRAIPNSAFREKVAYAYQVISDIQAVIDNGGEIHKKPGYVLEEESEDEE